MSATTCPYAVIFAVTMVLGSFTGHAQSKDPAKVLDDRSAADLAYFVGEPTGSKPRHFGDEAEFVLPYSSAMGQLAPGEHVDSLYRDDRVWIAPAIPASLASEDYFAGRDPALDAAIQAVSAE